MKLVAAFLRLIRWPNLVFIMLTQFMFYFCIVKPLYIFDLKGFGFNEWAFLILLSISSVFIAAAGYIINDYFDLNIDAINKPDKVVIDKIVKRRWGIMWHWILSFAGIAIGVYLDMKLHSLIFTISNIGCVSLLWFYSTIFKKKLMIGNAIISLLTAWVILVIFFALLNFPIGVVPGWHFAAYPFDVNKLIRLSLLYAGFAFIISLIREVIKDMEDIEGDAKYGCKTMPIVWGIKATKVFVAVWIIVLIGVLAIIQFYVLQFNWWLSAGYCLLLIIAPLFWILRKLYEAQSSTDYHKLSSVVKFVMLTGILSMIFFKIYS